MRLAGVRDPLRAVAELIWNGIDAEAATVSVKLSYNEMDGVETVTVVDDGHGMNSQDAPATSPDLEDHGRLRPSYRLTFGDQCTGVAGRAA